MIVVIRAEPSGFCMGVKRAVEMVEKERETKGPLYTLGPIIHNTQVLNKLARQGVLTAEPGDCFEAGSRVVIRAHGVEPGVEKDLAQKGVQILDGTCPKVKMSQKIIEEYSRKGFLIIILGDKNHGEVRGLAGRANNFILVSSPEEAQDLVLPEKTLFTCQTTVKQAEFDLIKAIIQNKNPSTIIKNAICPATKKRQSGVKELAGRVDAMVIVGGKNSANTIRLYQSAKEVGIPSFHIEQSNDLPNEIYSYEKVGVSAGASTPDYIIDEVIVRLKKG